MNEGYKNRGGSLLYIVNTDRDCFHLSRAGPVSLETYLQSQDRNILIPALD